MGERVRVASAPYDMAAGRQRKRVERLKEYAFILPALSLLGLIIFFPTVWAISLSFNQVTLVPPTQAFMGFELKPVGLSNYVEALGDPLFWRASLNTIIFCGATVIGSFLGGFLLAILLNQEIKGQAAWRVLMLLPWVIAPVVTATIWRWMYEPRYGVLNDLWKRIAPNADQILWLARPGLAMASVSVASIWARIPFMVVMLLAGLQAIPQEQYEAAAVDGASAWGRFVHVTIPHVRPVIVVATILETIWSFRSFDIIQVLTGGGPGRATDVLSTHVYKTSFTFFQFGPSSAISVLMMLFLLIFTVIYTRNLGRD